MKQTPPPHDESHGTKTGPDVRPGHAPDVEIRPLDPEFNIDDVFLSESAEATSAPLVEPLERDGNRDDRRERHDAQAPPDAVRPPERLEPGSDESVPGALSVAELLENGVSVDWTEAVAIARRICQAIARHPSAGAQEYLLDPRHIEITERGDVRVLPGAPGGDPLVKQVGRILRALLEGGEAPVQLRLVASQAAFELPGFTSVNELSEALRTFEHAPESDVIQMAFKRGREAKYSTPVEAAGWTPAAPPVRAVSVIGPVIPPAPEFVKRAPPTSGRHWASSALALVVTVGLVYLAVRGLNPSFERDVTPPPAEEISNASGTGSVDTAPLEKKIVVLPPPVVPQPVAPERARPVDPERPQTRSAAARGRPTNTRPLSKEDSSSEPIPRTVGVPQGTVRADEVQRAYDAIVLADPLYQLDPQRATPAAMAALRDSKRLLVPDLARRDYERAREALQAGENDRALTEAVRVARMLDEIGVGVAPVGLRESVRQLVARAEAALTREDQRVYTIADSGVTPPAALSRQLPAAPPMGVSNLQVGTLEMLISQAGQVEAIKLHTPLNRYHERMIVSAAKAWRYRPALKDGKPVRFRLVSSINLPES